MAESIPNNEDLFTCPICLDLLEDPVTLHCGHNFCMNCITGCWDQEDQKGIYSCPQCRETYTERPVLRRNNVIDEVVGQFREARFQIAAPGPAAAVALHAGPGDVECDVCTGKKLKAVKSCLECLVSYCETHLKAHNDVILGRKHKVVDATGQLQERVCTQHEKPLEIFCRTDQSCICFLCMVDEHKGHDTVSASAERKEKQTHLGKTQRKFQQRIQKREKEQQELIQAVETLKSSAATAVGDSERIFNEMIHFIEGKRSEVKEMIRAQEKAEVSRAEGLLKRLEQEIAELKRRDAELEQLSHTEDHIHFLKTFQPVGDELKDSLSITINQSFSFETVKKPLSSLKAQLKDLYIQEIKKITPSSFTTGFSDLTSKGDGNSKPFSFGPLFGKQFAKREGEWDCPTCCIRNPVSASSCVSCQTQNPSSKGNRNSTSFSFGPSFGKQFGKQFAKKEGEWDCPTCCVRNPASASSCVSCQTQNPSSEGNGNSTSFSFGPSFGKQFAKREGEWDCPTCCVRNPASLSSCIACQTRNPSSKGDGGTPKFSFGSSFSFGSQFAIKDGQWICDQCSVRNEKTSLKCISCQSPGSGTKGGLASMFAKKPGQWDCDVCLVRNEGSARHCSSCQTPNPTATPTFSFGFSFGGQ